MPVSRTRARRANPTLAAFALGIAFATTFDLSPLLPVLEPLLPYAARARDEVRRDTASAATCADAAPPAMPGAAETIRGTTGADR